MTGGLPVTFFLLPSLAAAAPFVDSPYFSQIGAGNLFCGFPVADIGSIRFELARQLGDRKPPFISECRNIELDPLRLGVNCGFRQPYDAVELIERDYSLVYPLGDIRAAYLQEFSEDPLADTFLFEECIEVIFPFSDFAHCKNPFVAKIEVGGS